MLNDPNKIIPSQVSEVGIREIDRHKAKEMNLLPTTRIGWEQKQQYTDWLAQLSAEGYLNAEEYDARMEWLQAARTEEEMKIPFRDLPRLRPTGMEPANPALRSPVKKKRKAPPVPMSLGITVIVLEAFLTSINMAEGHWGAALITFIALMVWSALVFMRLKLR